MRTLHVVMGLGGRAGQRSRALATVREAATAAGWAIQEIELDALAHLDAGDRAVLCGGDGLIHKALPFVAGRGVEVAIVPVGTGNDFVRAFGVTGRNAGPRSIATAVDPTAPATAVDLLRAEDDDGTGERWAASVVTFGFSGRVTDTANGLRFPPGSSKYTAAALLEIGRLDARPAILTIVPSDAGNDSRIDTGRPIEGDVALAAIANTAWFGGGMQICPDARADDGRLDVLTIGDAGRLEFARWLPKVFRGAHTTHDAVTTATGVSVRVETDEALWADGEEWGHAPTTITVVPGALQLVVP